MTDFFGGAPALSFKDPAWMGVVRGGRIVAEPKLAVVTSPQGVVQKWDDGSPKQQMIVTLLCDGSAEYAPGRKAHDERDPSNPHDLGKRRLYIKSHLVKAVREAIKKVHADTITLGGTLFVVWASEEEARVKGNSNSKIFQAMYALPTVALPSEGPTGDANPFAGSQPPTGPAVTSGAQTNPFGSASASQPSASAPAPNPFG